VAVISAKANLAEDTKSRRSVLYLDSRATPQQTAAFALAFQLKIQHDARARSSPHAPRVLRYRTMA
jgi:hypothetical protein